MRLEIVSRFDGRAEQAIAKLDAAADLDLGLPHHFRGTSLAQLSGCADRAETAAADLEFVLAVKDQFPPGLPRAAHEVLSRPYGILGRAEEAEAARSQSGRLITGYWVTPGDGFRFLPQGSPNSRRACMSLRELKGGRCGKL